MQREADEFVVPGEGALDVQDAEFFFIRNTDRSIAGQIDAFEVWQIGREQLHAIVMHPFLIFINLKVLQPGA